MIDGWTDVHVFGGMIGPIGMAGQSIGEFSPRGLGGRGFSRGTDEGSSGRSATSSGASRATTEDQED